MKILYIAKERRAAELAASALSAATPDVVVGWAVDLDEARRWIGANRDAATVIVEVDSDSPAYESFIREARASGITPAVVVVWVTGHGAVLPALEAVADEIVAKDPFFLNELPAIVSRALDSARPRAHSSTALQTEPQSAFDAQLVEASRFLGSLKERLHDATSAIEQARTEHATEAAALAAQHQRRTTELAEQVANVTSVKQTLETRLAETEASAKRLAQQMNEALLAASAQAQADREADAAAAATRLAAREAELTSRIEGAATIKEELERRLADADTTLRYIEQRAAADEAAAHHALAAQQAELEAERARSAANRQALEHQIAEAVTALGALRQKQAKLIEAMQDAEQRAASDREAAARLAAERQTQLETEIAREVTRRLTLEQALTDAEAERVRAGQRHAEEIAAAAQRFTEYEQHARTRLTEADATAAALEGMLADSTAASRRLEQHYAAEVTEAVARQTEFQKQSEARLAQASATLNILKVKLAERTTALQRIEADSSAAAEDAERRLVTAVSAMRQRARDYEALEERAVRTTQQLQERVESLGDELAANRRRFDQTPASIFRCDRDGKVEWINPALANLLGYDTVEKLQSVDLATTVFESADELKWLAERCLTSGSPESIETTWRKQDDSRIIVRVSAVATAQDSVDLTAQDITAQRSLEEKLRQSQRMEAVARYASEVALTCDAVLGNVKQKAQQWLTGPDGVTARHQADLMLEDVTRASVLLQRLAVYGKEEKNAPALVDLNRVLRDLEPVLKRVAGGHIEFVLPKALKPHNLDVDAERVERILVNVAAYGRERMPLGGRLTFEAAPVIVDRAFVEKYPNVRPGSHVLLTVTEKRGAARQGLSAVDLLQTPEGGAGAPAGSTPGVDLEILQTLVGDCRGHLWMTVEPPGDMVLKIHLPRRVLDDTTTAAPRTRGAALRAA